MKQTAIMYCRNPGCTTYNAEQFVPTEYSWDTCDDCGSLLQSTPDTDAHELSPNSIKELFADQIDEVDTWDWMAEEALPVIAAWYRLTQNPTYKGETRRQEDADTFMRLVRKYGEGRPEQ